MLILGELIETEEIYVEKLEKGLQNYAELFQRSDLPTGLVGKEYALLGNIREIYEFHRTDFLPMLQRNSYDLQRLFEEFEEFITVSFGAFEDITLVIFEYC